MIRKHTLFAKLLLIVGISLTVTCVHAITLDWDSVDWASGATSQTFSDVEGSGVDITISLSLSNDWEYHSNSSGSRGYWTQSDFLSESPNDKTTFGGDGSTQNGESLYLGVNFASDEKEQSYLDVTISFSTAVQYANFSLFDVDQYGTSYKGGYEYGTQFVDIIEQVQGSYLGNTVAGNVSHGNKIVEHTDANGTYYQGNTILSSSSDQNDNPQSSLNLAWSNPVDTISFRYTTGSGAVADPGQQAIGLSGIGFYEYQAVPEPSTYVVGLLIPALAFFAYRRKKLQQNADVNDATTATETATVSDLAEA